MIRDDSGPGPLGTYIPPVVGGRIPITHDIFSKDAVSIKIILYVSGYRFYPFFIGSEVENLPLRRFGPDDSESITIEDAASVHSR
jgi:hypothetical protein